MGTNYYLRLREEHKIHVSYDDYDERHIAKFSYGWKPSFQSHSEIGLNSIDDIKEMASESGLYDIYDEYGDKIELNDFIDKVESWGANWDFEPESHAGGGSDAPLLVFKKDRYGNEFTEREFS